MPLFNGPPDQGQLPIPHRYVGFPSRRPPATRSRSRHRSWTMGRTSAMRYSGSSLRPLDWLGGGLSSSAVVVDRAAPNRGRNLMRRSRIALLPTIALALLGCGDDIAADRRPNDGGDDGPSGNEPSVEVVASGLEVPWALDFAPAGRIFVTERPGRIRVIEGGALRDEPWAEVRVTHRGEAGLMGIALAPDYETSGHLYVIGSFEAWGRLTNRVIRYTERDGKGADPKVMIEGLPSNAYHAGGRLYFGPDGMLYVTAVDVGDSASSQDPGSLAGKILRFTPEGGILADNPLPGSPVYALGVRNSQGLACGRARDTFRGRVRPNPPGSNGCGRAPLFRDQQP